MSHTLFGLLHRRYGEPSSAQAAIRAIRDATERIHVPLPGEGRAVNGLKVVVIGAGFAGLSAGAELSEKGFEVTVLEAQAQVGGRVESRSTVSNGRMIEAGAELIGANHPLWVAMASEYGLGLSAFTTDHLFDAAKLNQPTFLRGKILTPGEAKQLYEKMDQVFALISDDASTIDNPCQPWKSANAATWDNMSVAERLKEFGVTPDELLWDALAVQLENDQTVAMDRQSYLGLTAVVRGGQLGNDKQAFWTMSEMFRCEEGNQALARKLRDIINATPKCVVLLENPVSTVNVGESGVEVTARTGRFSFDYVVMAVPQPAWANLTITPAIDRSWHITTGPAVKYLSPVRGRFWLNKQLAPAGVSDQFGMTWEGTDNQMVAADQGIELSVFAGGLWADEARRRPDKKAYFTAQLATLFPGYTDQALAGDVFMDWPANPWIRCGYSCPTVGQVTTAAPRLFEMYAGRLAFAGEHTMMGMFGYMEGALESGIWAANLIETAAGIT